MKINYHSGVNQDVLGKLVNREIYKNQSYLVGDLLKYYYDQADFINLYVDNSEEIGTTNNKIHELIIKKDIAEDELLQVEKPTLANYTYRNSLECKIGILNSSIKNLEDIVSQLEEEHGTHKEPLEWWLCTRYFTDKLEAKGEAILELFGERWWGRTCSGQAIILDYVIGSIGEDMQILEGQINHKFWK